MLPAHVLTSFRPLVPQIPFARAHTRVYSLSDPISSFHFFIPPSLYLGYVKTRPTWVSAPRHETTKQRLSQVIHSPDVCTLTHALVSNNLITISCVNIFSLTYNNIEAVRLCRRQKVIFFCLHVGWGAFCRVCAFLANCHDRRSCSRTSCSPLASGCQYFFLCENRLILLVLKVAFGEKCDDFSGIKWSKWRHIQRAVWPSRGLYDHKYAAQWAVYNDRGRIKSWISAAMYEKRLAEVIVHIFLAIKVERATADASRVGNCAEWKHSYSRQKKRIKSKCKIKIFYKNDWRVMPLSAMKCSLFRALNGRNGTRRIMRCEEWASITIAFIHRAMRCQQPA